MKTTFAHQNASDRLLVFFNGWGMDNALFQRWRGDGDFDVLIAWDYTCLTPLPPLSGYREVRLVAWSLGVWAAAVAALPPLARATAVNGTLRPIDEHHGIRPAVFQGTIDNWLNDEARERFRQRAIGMAAAEASAPPPVGGAGPAPGRQPLDQRDELQALQDRITGRPEPANIYDLALIGGRDRIFPPPAQRRFWSRTAVSCREWADAPHYPFAGTSSWQELWNLE